MNERVPPSDLMSAGRHVLFAAPPADVMAAEQDWLRRGTPGVWEGKNAVVMPVKLAPPGPNQPMYWGGVRDAQGDFVSYSGLSRSWVVVVAAGPDDELIGVDSDKLSGDSVFCGFLFNHFGHFLVECTTRLWWAINSGFQGRYVFQVRTGGKMPSFAKSFFELLEIDDRVVLIDKLTVCENLVVPEPAFCVQLHAWPEMLVPFVKIRERLKARATSNGPKKIYFSRTHLEAGAVVGEREAEAMLTGIGYCSIAPERLSLDEQIRLVIDADEVAGTVGSAMHLLLFTEQKSALYIARSKIVNRNYFIIDQLTGNNSRYIYASGRINRSSYGLTAPHLLDPERLKQGLLALGMDPLERTFPPPELLEREFLSLWHANLARVHSQKGEVDAALKAVLLAHLLAPTNDAFRSSMSSALLRAGLPEEAAFLAPQ